MIDEAVGELVPPLQRSEERQPKRLGADGFPERAQSLDPFFRRIAGNQRRVDGTDRNSGDPVRVQVRLGQSLVYPRLVGAERTPALQDQCDALERRPLGCEVGLPMRGSTTGHGQRRLWTRRARIVLLRTVLPDALAVQTEGWIHGQAQRPL